MTFTPGQKVRTPRGKGVIVHHFPAGKRKQYEAYTVRLPDVLHAVVFYARELKG